MQPTTTNDNENAIERDDDNLNDEEYIDDDYDENEDLLREQQYLMQESEESRLWENDSSYLVAVSPKIFENDRIRLKVIMGYRVQSLVHGLDNDYNAQNFNSANSPLVPFNRRQRNRLAQFYNRNRMNLNMSPEQFNQLPEHQQRRILRERYLSQQWRENRDLRDGLMQTSHQRQRQRTPYNSSSGNPASLGTFMNWASTNMNQLGWRSLVGIVAFVLGLYRTTRGS